MKVEKIIVGNLKTNCWLAIDPDSGLGIIIDPGAKWKQIMGMVEKNNAEVRAIVLTHAHGDHIAAAYQLMEKTAALLYRHPLRIGKWGAQTIEEKFRDRVRDMNDGDEINVGAINLKAIHTPGHSPGGVCLYGEGMLFSGDLLFKGAVGRYDLTGSDLDELKESLFRRIAHIPDETTVLPGHGPSTTLGEERKTNPIFTLNRKDT